jgi:quinol-cytochrome oxidoreductase complex cytochrome b subunit
MNLGPTELIVVLFIFALLALPLWGIVDAAVRPDSAWRAADQNKVLWIVLMIVLGLIGTLIYFIAIRPKVSAAERRAN